MRIDANASATTAFCVPTVVAVTEGDRELLATAQVAKLLGISTGTLVRYAEKGYVTPEMTLPSSHRRWVMEDVLRQIRDSGSSGRPANDAEAIPTMHDWVRRNAVQLYESGNCGLARRSRPVPDGCRA